MAESELILQTRRLTHRAISSGIESYLSSQSDADVWRDLFTTSTGKLVIDVLSGLTEMLSYRIETRGRESYLYTAQSKSSLYLLAQVIGYNPNRKFHQSGFIRATISLPPEVDFVIPAWYQFEYNDLPYVIAGAEYQGLRDDPLSTTIPVSQIPYLLVRQGERVIDGIQLWQGTWVDYKFTNDVNDPDRNEGLQGIPYEILIIPEPNFQLDQFNVAVSVDGTFYTKAGNSVGGRTFKLVERIQDLDEDSIVLRTDYTGFTFLLFGDGDVGPLLSPSSEVVVRYLRTAGDEADDIPRGTSLGTFDFGGNEVEFEVSERISGGTREDSEEKVRLVAAQWFQTGGRAVTKKDIEAVSLSFPGVISAKANKTDEQCCEFDLALLLANEDPVTNLLNVFPHPPLFEEQFLDYMEDYKMLSAKINVIQPTEIPLRISIELTVRPGYDQNAIELAIEERLRRYANQLGITFRTTQFVDFAADLSSFIQQVKILSVEDRSGTLRDDYPDITLEFNEYYQLDSFPIAFNEIIGAF